MHVGQHRYANLFFDLVEDGQAGINAKTAKALVGAAVGLVVARLVDERQAKAAGHFLELAGGIDGELFTFDDAGTGNQEEGLVEPHVESTQFHA